MAKTSNISNLEDLLDRMADAARDEGEISLGKIVEAIGRRSFGPLLLFCGLITVSPVGGIPGLPSVLAVLVLLVAVQLLLHRREFWLPAWILRRKVSHDTLCKTVKWSRKPARFIDRFLKARLMFFTNNSGAYFMAVICVVVALGMPPMEFVPFSVTIAGATLALFGLALIAHDGLIALGGILFALGAYGFLLYALF